MARKAEGTVVFRPGGDGGPGKWWARITCADGSRPWVPLKGAWPNTDKGRERAKEAARGHAEQFRRRGIVGVPLRGAKAKALAADGEDPWWGRFFALRQSRGLYDVSGTYRKHIKPVVPGPIAAVTQDDSERLRVHLNGLARAGKITGKTAFNARTVWTTACKAACGSWPKDDARTLKVRADNPAAGVFAPERQDAPETQFLYPDEFLQLVQCERVPLLWRRIYALLTYTFTRGSELRGLRWTDVDLEHGVLAVRQQVDDDGASKALKTGGRGVRRFALEPRILPLLRALKQEGDGGDFVISMPDRREWASSLQRHLKLAGITRSELTETVRGDVARGGGSRRLRLHDLRGTGLTWCAVRGDEPLRIQQRAGHTDFAMTNDAYIRTAEAIRGSGASFGEPFPELPKRLLGPAAANDSTPRIVHANRPVGPKCSESLWVDRDSNPGPTD